MATGIGVGVEVLVGKRLLSELLAANRAPGNLENIVPELVVLLVTAALVSLGSIIQAEQQRVMSELVTRHVQNRLLDVAVTADLESYETPTFLDRLQRAEIAGQSRPWQMTMGLLILLSAGFTVVGIAVALVTIEALLLPLVLVSSIPFWLATLRNSREGHAFAYGMTPVDRERRYVSEVLMGPDFAKEVRMFGLAPFLRRMHDVLYDRRIAALRRLVRKRLRRSLAATALTAGLTAMTVAVLVSLVRAEHMDVAGAITAALAVQQLGMRLRIIYASAGSLYEGALFLDDLDSFLRPEVEGDHGAVATRTARPAAPFSAIELEDVSFSYPGTDRWALSRISLEIRAGEVVALVGENGSGKTTLAKLLCHLYRPTSGRILWDGVDTATWDANDLRRFVTGIFQDFAQYQFRARDNVAIGRHERFSDFEGIVAAAKQAGAHDFLSALPESYETRLGRQFEGGRELSIGQWQRVALARAFFRGAPFIILDEPTAALDARAEHELFSAVRGLAHDRTLLLISHRFSSVRSADRIIVLDDGQIVEQGTHDELMARKGLYADLFTLQAASYLDPPKTSPWGPR